MKLDTILLVLFTNCVCMQALNIGERDPEWTDSFQLCKKCGKPLVNKVNIQILQARLRIILFSAGIPIVLVGGYVAFSMLPWLGFGTGGILAGSFAAAWQASMGGTIAKGSLFAILQSIGTSFMYNVLFGTMSGSTLIYVLLKVEENAEYLYFCDCKSK